MRTILPMVLLLMFAGCTATGKAFVEKTHEDAKNAADATAVIMLIAPCGMTHGAYERLDTADQRAVDALECGNR